MDLNYLKYCKSINNLNGVNGCRDSFLSEMVSDYNEAKANVITKFSVMVNTVDAKDIYINNSTTSVKAVIDDRKKQGATSDREEYIQTYPNLIKSGDNVKFKYRSDDIDNYALITSDIEKKNGYDEGVFLLCNQFITWKGLSVLPIPCWLNNSSYGSKGEVHNIEQISDFDARAVILVGMNEYTSQIRNGMRFIFNHSKDDVYEVTKKTTAYNSNGVNGYISLTCKYVKWVQEDDFVNNIAFNSFLEDNVNPSIDIDLIGEENVLINSSATYTMQNATNVTFVLDEDTILEGNAEIVSQNGINCVIKILKSCWLQIECRDSLGKLLKTKTIYGVTRLV